jgi:hypothetical protein
MACSRGLEGLVGTGGDWLPSVAVTRNVSDAREPITVTPPTLAECGRPWLDPTERWRSLVDDEGAARLFCPVCAREEFDNG